MLGVDVGAVPYKAKILSFVIRAFSASLGAWLKKSCSSLANVVVVRSLLELFEDGWTGALVVAVVGALRKLLKASVLKSIVVGFDGGNGTLLVGDDRPSKSNDPELLSIIGARFDVFGLPELA